MKRAVLAVITALFISLSLTAGPVVIDFTNLTNVDPIPTTPDFHGFYWSSNQSYLSLYNGSMVLSASASVTTDDAFALTCLGKPTGCGPYGVGLRSRTGDLSPALVDDLIGAGEMLSLYSFDPTLSITSLQFATPLGKLLHGEIGLYVDGGPLIPIALSSSTTKYTFAQATQFQRIDIQPQGLRWTGFALTSIDLETPEPASAVLLLSGFLGIAVWKRRN